MAFFDYSFEVSGNPIPADNSYSLFGALCKLLPFLHEDLGVGVHPLNGKYTGDRQLTFDRRSRLVIRSDREKRDWMIGLQGQALVIEGERVQIGALGIKPLLNWPRLYSSRVILSGHQDPFPFLFSAQKLLAEMGIQGNACLVPNPRSDANAKLGTGSRSPVIRRTINVRGVNIVAFAVRVEGLSGQDSLALQEKGLGGKRHFGCGIFTPENRA